MKWSRNMGLTVLFGLAAGMTNCKKNTPEPTVEEPPTDTTTTVTDTSEVVPEDTVEVIPDNVLIYYGNGGVGPEGMWGDMTHEETIEMCADSGVTATHSASWPTDLSEYRTVIFPASGFNDDGAYYESDQVSDLNDYVSEGGYLLIEGENSPVLNSNVINDLLNDLGCDTRFNTGTTGGSGTDILTSSLTDEVTQVGILAGGILDPGTDLRLVSDDGSSATLVTAKQIGDGYVIVSCDGNMFSDLGTWDAGLMDNRKLLMNILRLL